jgi:hypothetical protein
MNTLIDMAAGWLVGNAALFLGCLFSVRISETVGAVIGWSCDVLFGEIRSDHARFD